MPRVTATSTPTDRRSVVLGVTADKSVGLLRGFPAYLATQGWAVHVVSSCGPLSDELSRETGVHVHQIEMERSLSPIKDLCALVRWTRLLSILQPDLLYVGTPKAGLLGTVAGAIIGVPSRIYLLRGLRSESLPRPWSSWLNLLERVTVRCADEVVCVSRSLRQAAYEAGVLQPGQGVVLGGGSSNGVATNVEPLGLAERVAQRRRYFPEPDRFTVGFVGRVTRDKGIDILAAALFRLARAGLAGNCLVIGGDDSLDGPGLRAALDGSGWSTCHLGQLADVAPAVSTIDVLCLPSRREGFPNVVLEAAVAGVPCVGSQATGMADAVVDGMTGVTVPTEDVPALADALSDIMRHPERRDRLGQAARRRALAEFGRARVWSVQSDFLRSMLSAPSSPRRQRERVGV